MLDLVNLLWPGVTHLLLCKHPGAKVTTHKYVTKVTHRSSSITRQFIRLTLENSKNGISTVVIETSTMATTFTSMDS